MKVLISSVGTRGDVQPAVALARQLRDLGATVRLCVPPNFVDWIAELGFEVRPIGIEMRAPRPGAAPAPVPDLITDQFDVLKAAAGDCDVVVGAGLHQYAARSIAELDGKRYAIAAYAPVSLPSGDLPPPGRPTAADVQQLWADVRRSWNQRGLERVNTNRAA